VNITQVIKRKYIPCLLFAFFITNPLCIFNMLSLQYESPNKFQSGAFYFTRMVLCACDNKCICLGVVLYTTLVGIFKGQDVAPFALGCFIRQLLLTSVYVASDCVALILTLSPVYFDPEVNNVVNTLPSLKRVWVQKAVKMTQFGRIYDDQFGD
jgi:hypothetical protein